MPLVQDFLQPYARLATTNRLVLYGLLSTLAVSLVILNAFKSYSNFYSVAVYLSRSNRSVMVLANFAVLGSLLAGRGLQHVLFGSLRANEVERLYDRIWFFLTESLLAFTIFRDEFDVNFGVMFGFLLFVKCFHWLMSFRIEWMDQIQYPGPNVWFHVRMNVLFLFLWCIDTIMLCFAIESILTNGMGGIVLFASEYAILMASALNSMSKYFIIFYDIRRAAARGGENAPIWEDKSMFIFYVELVTDFLKLITYLTFFLLVLTFYGLPLNIVRDVYLTARSFINRCRDLVRYRTATRNMDERYPNATEDELTQMSDRTCIICREEMVFRAPAAQPAVDRQPAGINDTPKKLPCGHVFHFHCLRSWLERQQSCPTCRRTVLETRPPPQNTGAAGQPRPPAAPQPGAIPQIPGFGVPVAVQQQQPGFLARILGNLVGAPPAVPGQFAPPPAQFNQQQGVINNLPPPPQGFPAQNPFGPWQQPGYYVPAQQGPAPVQVLQGFYIGNQWQPWGIRIPPQPQQVRPQQARPLAQAPPPIPGVVPQANVNFPPPAPTGAAPGTGVTPTRPVRPSRSPSEASIQSGEPSIPRRPAGSASTAEPFTPSSGPLTGQSNPREAAAQAALRRLNSSGGSSVSSQTTPDSPGHPSLSSATVGEPMGTTTASTPRGLSPNPSTTQTPAPAPRPASAAPATPGPRPPRPPVPSLIPLFDPATTSATIVAPPPLYRAPHTPSTPYQLHPNAHPPPFSPQHQHQQRPRPRPAETFTNAQVSELLRGASGVPDIRSLPQTLTVEQLNRLDVLTRDAIDERLRALENIQGAMWRCSEELVRIRSALPVRQPSVVGTQTQDSVQHRDKAPERGSDSSDEKGKAKDLVQDEFSEAGPSPSTPVSGPVVPTVVQVEPSEGGPTLVADAGEVVVDPAL